MFDPNISDIKYYNSEMKKSLIDKAFFLDKVDVDIFVDFGCADGSLIEFIEEMFPGTICIGYDISKHELEIAATKTKSKLFSNWNKLTAYLNKIRKGKRVAVICNSLIHEVYAYGDKNSVDTFWKQIYSDNFDVVIIRDMCVSRNVNRQSDPISVAKVRKTANQNRLAEFEAQWGVIDSNWSLVHFLLKYRYEKNWDREVLENYLPLNYEDMLKLIPDNYKPVYADHFALPFTRNQISKDFDIDLQDNTHVKLILERN